MSARKPPRCRSCKHPMKGHNKLGLCLSATPEALTREEEEEEEALLSSKISAHSYMSPPPTPPPSSSSCAASESSANEKLRGPIPLLRANINHVHRTYTPAIMSEPSFIIPETGYFHRRNPNYVHAPPEIDVPGASGSQTPTVIIGSDGESVGLSDRSRSASPPTTPRADRYRRLDALSNPLFVVHETNGHGIDEVRARAANLGLQTAVMAPRRSYSFFDGGVSFLGGLNWKRALPLPTPQNTWIVAGPKLDAIPAFADTSKHGAAAFNSTSFLVFTFVVCITGTIMGTYISKFL